METGKIVIAGGMGFLGNILSRYFAGNNYEVIILSRKPFTSQHVKTALWDGITPGDWVQELEGAKALINLCGKSVDCRYTAKNKAAIINSRIQSTRALGLALQQCKQLPGVWLNSSSATIYRHAEDRPMDEATGEIGKGFSVEVCKAWEKELFSHAIQGVTKTALRIALVMGPEGGAYPVLKKLTRAGLGGKMAAGRQYISWIHAHDFCLAIDWLLRYPTEGAVNIAALGAVKNAAFMKALQKSVGMPFGMPHPRWLLEVGAFFLQTETELMLKSRWVIPGILQQQGFAFQYPEIGAALRSLAK